MMSRVNFSQERPVEFFMLMKPQPDGPIMGTYAGEPIAATVVDLYGRRYSYIGVAPRLRSGRYDLDSLSEDEWLVEPGLVYRGHRKASGGWLTHLQRSGSRKPKACKPR